MRLAILGSAIGMMLCSSLSIADPFEIKAKITVTTSNDISNNPAECSLRDAFANVNAGGKVGTNKCAKAALTVDREATQIDLSKVLVVYLNDEIWQSDNYARVIGGIIDAQSKTRMLRVSNDGTYLSLQNDTLQHGMSGGSGGAILVENGADLDTFRTSIKYCRAASDGGAIELQGSEFANIEYTSFYRNSAGMHGGAIRAGSTDLTITNSRIAANYSGMAGGGIYLAPSAITYIRDSRITNNSVASDPLNLSQEGYGGGIYNAGTLWLHVSDIEENYVDHGNGGGIYLENSQGQVEIKQSRFNQNQAGKKAKDGDGGNNGGALYSDSGFVSNGNSFSGNRADNGGAIVISDAAANSNIDIINSSFVYNFASQVGAALWVTEYPTLVIPDETNPLGAEYKLKVLHNTMSQNLGGSQVHLQDGQPADKSILFVNNIVDSLNTLACSGYVGRLLTKRSNDIGSTSYISQYPGSTCDPGTAPTIGAVNNVDFGWYFKSFYSLTLLTDQADPVVCAFVGNVDEFTNPRKCRFGAVEQKPPSVTDPPIFSH